MDRETFFNLVKISEDETLENMSKRTAYYMKVYDGKRWFNWSAFLFKEWWFFYRKMYLIAIIYSLILSFGMFASNLLSTRLFSNTVPSFTLFLIVILLWVSIFVFFFLPFLGNRLYFWHLKRLHLKGVKRSGVSLKSLFVLLIIYLILLSIQATIISHFLPNCY